jgi:hypothetical protein
MKKLFVLLAFTGIMGSAAASTVANFASTSVVSMIGEEKKGDDKKKKDEKACCKKDAKAEGKACAGEKTETKACAKEGKSCCKAKAEAAATPAAEPVKK